MKRTIIGCNVDSATNVDALLENIRMMDGLHDVSLVQYIDDEEEELLSTRLKFFRVFVGFKRWFRRPKEGLMLYVAASDKSKIAKMVSDVLKRKMVLMYCNEEKDKTDLSDMQYLQELAICDFIEGIK